MQRGIPVLVIAGIVSGALAGAQQEPQLPSTTERLTPAEEKLVRRAIATQGPTTASRSLKEPYPRLLVVPRDIARAYAKKPRATTRLLLKIVEGGRPWDSIHAVACIEALTVSPEFAAITAQGANDKKWDDIIGGANPYTFREHSRRVCIKLIAGKEKGKAATEKQ